ncbi:MAG: 30S ribosomal protein S18 [Patescibacteria group bacterium]
MTKQCHFCTNNIQKIDYKNIDVFEKFTDTQAKILPKKQTGLCVKHQKGLSQAIKRARFLALIPFVKN